MAVPDVQRLDVQPLYVESNHWTTEPGRRRWMYCEYRYEIRRLEDDGSRPVVRSITFPSRFVLRALREYVGKRRRDRKRPRGAPLNPDVTRALELRSQGVVFREICRQLGKRTASDKRNLAEAVRQRVWRKNRDKRKLN